MGATVLGGGVGWGPGEQTQDWEAEGVGRRGGVWEGAGQSFCLK